jgi:hypothetical protein
MITKAGILELWYHVLLPNVPNLEEQQVHDKETQVKGARLDVQHFSIFCSSHLTKLNRKSSTTITRPWLNYRHCRPNMPLNAILQRHHDPFWWCHPWLDIIRATDLLIYSTEGKKKSIIQRSLGFIPSWNFSTVKTIETKILNHNNK